MRDSHGGWGFGRGGSGSETRAGELLAIGHCTVLACVANPSLAAVRGIGVERVTATTVLAGRNIEPDPKGLLVNASVTYRGQQGTLTASPEAGGYWTVQMDDGAVHSLYASQFSVVGVEPEAVEAPAARAAPLQNQGLRGPPRRRRRVAAIRGSGRGRAGLSGAE